MKCKHPGWKEQEDSNKKTNIYFEMCENYHNQNKKMKLRNIFPTLSRLNSSTNRRLLFSTEEIQMPHIFYIKRNAHYVIFDKNSKP